MPFNSEVFMPEDCKSGNVTSQFLSVWEPISLNLIIGSLNA